MCLALSTCEPAYAFGHKQTPVPVASASPAPLPSPEPSPSPLMSGVPTISVGKITGATAKELTMIAEGAAFANKMLAGYCFKQWVLSSRYTENNGLSQQQIWDLMATHPVTVDIEMYTGDWWANHKSKTIGYENDPWDGIVHMNRYFVNTAFMVADNLWHEAQGHSQGFHHYGKFSTSDPYGMNYAGEGCSEAQKQQAKGARRFKPPGIRLEIRDAKWRKKHLSRRPVLRGKRSADHYSASSHKH